MLNTEANLLNQIAKSREIIRRKHRLLKSGIEDAEQNVNEVLKPIITPLNALANIPKTEWISEVKKRKIDFKHSTPMNIQQRSKIEKEMSPMSQKSFYESASSKNFRNDYNEKSPYASEDEDDQYEELENKTNIIKNFSKNKSIISEDESNIQENNNLSYYFKLLNDKSRHIDRTLGVRKFVNGDNMIGNKLITFDSNSFKVDNDKYPLSEGLLELIFKKQPNDAKITNQDVKLYKEIIEKTNAAKKNYKANGAIRRDVTYNNKKKYIENKFNKSGGSILPKFMKVNNGKTFHEYTYWNDPNELVDRLRLLLAERSAGNQNHDNEIQSIIEELREERIIY